MEDFLTGSIKTRQMFCTYCHYDNLFFVITTIYLLSLQQPTYTHYDNLITVITTVYFTVVMINCLLSLQNLEMIS